MKALFVGVGSIGTRHIIDFYQECLKHNDTPIIHVLRRKTGELDLRLYEIISKQYTSIQENYDVIFITNPTFLHYNSLNMVKDNAKFFFIEKPLFDRLDYDYRTLGINEKNAYVAAPMRHTRIYARLMEILQHKRVYSARIICSSYLPDWRPNIDYRNNYSAIKQMGGGVSLDLIHELDYAVGLFGFPKKVYRINGTYSELEISSDDLSAYILEYKDMLCEVHLDYFGMEYRRSCEVFTNEGTYVADFAREIIVMPNKEIVDCKDMPDGEFKHEMEYFYNFMKGSANIVNSPEHAYDVLKVAIGNNGEK